ncbi:MAG: hypothetical protein J6A37_06570 [Oscillospiraceae bacterium]|nr:hypothetical protein [Oscillospiraceae bacterium]
MKNMSISRGQAIIMLTLFGVLFCVLNTDYSSMGKMLADTAVTVIILSVMAIPLVILAGKCSGTVPMICSERLGIFGKAADVVFFIYFTCAAGDVLSRYGEFACERYFREAVPVICTAMLGAICIYISHTGAETVCRMSTVLLIMLVLTSAVFVFGGADDIADFDYSTVTAERLSLTDGFGGLFPLGAAGTAVLCILCGGLGKKTRCGLYAGLAAMLTAAVLITGAVWTTLEGYVFSSEYPLTDSVIYASRGATFRNDGLFFSLWTVIAAAVISLLCACAGHSFKCVFNKIRYEGIISGTAAVILAIISIYTEIPVCRMIYAVPVLPVFLVSVIPLILLFAVKGKENR